MYVFVSLQKNPQVSSCSQQHLEASTVDFLFMFQKYTAHKQVSINGGLMPQDSAFWVIAQN